MISEYLKKYSYYYLSRYSVTKKKFENIFKKKISKDFFQKKITREKKTEYFIEVPDVVKYFKIWPNLPPDFFPGSIIIDLSIISRNQINDIDNLKIDILKDYGNIKKNLNFEDDDVKVLMSKIQISDIHDLFVNNKSFNIKSRCMQMLTCLEGYIKAMEENKDDLLKLECCKKSEGGMSYF